MVLAIPTELSTSSAASYKASTIRFCLNAPKSSSETPNTATAASPSESQVSVPRSASLSVSTKPSKLTSSKLSKSGALVVVVNSPVSTSSTLTSTKESDARLNRFPITDRLGTRSDTSPIQSIGFNRTDLISLIVWFNSRSENTVA